MSDQLLMFDLTTLKTLPNAISSPELADGHAHSDSPDGLMIAKSGQVPALASASALPEKAKAQATTATFGRYLPASLPSENLQSFLANRLQRRLATVGSTVYAQTWKKRVTPSGVMYWAHTASAQTISGTGCTGWPTPDSSNARDGKSLRKDNNLGTGMHGVSLHHATENLVGWATPTVQDAENCAVPSQFDRNSQPLNVQVFGTTQNSSCAVTEKPAGYQLNPNFSLWLMGYPAEWASCGARAMQSFRRLPKSS